MNIPIIGSPVNLPLIFLKNKVIKFSEQHIKLYNLVRISPLAQRNEIQPCLARYAVSRIYYEAQIYVI